MSVAPPNLRRWSRTDYHRAVESGAIRPEERLELIDGQVVEKMPQNPPHVVAIRLISRLFEEACGTTCDVRVQAPIALDEFSEPEPDLAIAKGVARDYLAEHPRPEEIELLIEVCDSTLARDRRMKVPLYANAGIREVWLIDLQERRLEAYREPTTGGYGQTTILMEDHALSPLFLPERSLRVSDLMS